MVGQHAPVGGNPLRGVNGWTKSGLVCAAPTASPLEVDETACGVVGALGEAAVPKSARWRRWQGRGGTGGRKSVSQPLVRYGIGRVLVTTSRLQRLVRSIFSLLGEDTSVSKHGGE